MPNRSKKYKDFKYKNTVGTESTYPKDMPEDHSNIPVWNSENVSP